MAYKVIYKFVRLGSDVEFYSRPADVAEHIFQTYDEPGKRVSREMVLSEDGLSQTVTNIWSSKQAYEEMLADPAVPRNIESYCTAHNIVFSTEFIEE